jgi:hypothetical protein
MKKPMNESPKEIDVTVSEVGPRDGLQMLKRAMPTELTAVGSS